MIVDPTLGLLAITIVAITQPIFEGFVEIVIGCGFAPIDPC